MRKRFNNFDYLRLFLALEVVGLHCHVIGGYGTSYAPINPVPAFVALSGFLIPGSFDSQPSYGRFIWKRALRVMPALIAALLLELFLVGPARLPDTIVLYLSAGLIFGAAVNQALWSLMLEEWLYASHLLSRAAKLWRVETAIFMCLALVGWATWMNFAWHIEKQHLLQERIVRTAAAYFAGNVLYFYKARLPKLGWIAPALVCALSSYLMVRLGLQSEWYAVLTAISAATAVLVCFNLPQTKLRIPDLSYGVYVYHLPVIFALVEFQLKGTRWILLCVPITLAIAGISWYLIEDPALKLKDRTLKLRKPSIA